MGKALGSSKVTVRFQVTVPEEVRKKLKIKEGDTLVFVEENKKKFSKKIEIYYKLMRVREAEIRKCHKT